MVATIALAAVLILVPDEWSEFRALSRDRDPERRCEAVAKIRPLANLAMVQALLPLMADPHARVRKRAAEAVARASAPDCVDFLHKAGLRHPLKIVRVLAAGCLGAIHDASSAGPLAASLGDPDPEVRAAACAALALLEAREFAAKVASLAERDSAWPTKAAALEALVALDRDAATRLATTATTDRAWQVRLAAARIAPGLDPETGLAVYLAAIADGDWRVRVQAIESACLLRVRETIGPLVDLLGKERGRLRWDLYLALRDLTGKELGLDAPNWKRWWDVNRDTFEVPPRPVAGEAVERPNGETGVQFFTLPILSTRMSFVLDLSGSMRDPAPPVPGRPAESKLDLAKREMGRTIAQIPEAVWFNLLFLGCDQEGRYAKERMAWKRTLQPATPRGRAEAAAFLNRQEGHGWTNIWDGIELAFEDEAVDTIYLYTDGGCSRGVFVATDDIFDELRKMNRFRKIMIHTVEVAGEKKNTADNIKLLKGVAEQTKGMYRLAK
ncbi:MAG TPA: HEAT repeat domain-containing protein [Planctomycetota bacterium]